MGNNLYGSMIELQIINYVFFKNSIQVFILNNITEEYFTTYVEHYRFIIDYYEKYNQLPSKETFQAKFNNNFEWLIISDPEEYLISKLREAKLFRDIIKDYNYLGNLIKDEKTDIAVEKMAEISQRFLKSKQASCIDLIGNADIRYNNYIEKIQNPNEAFVTTGLKELDKILGGWDLQNETALICARTGFGKSWWLIYFALHAAMAGLTVGFYSGEMELDLVGYRLDTFLSNISNGALTHGNDSVKSNYESYINTLNKIVKGHIYCITPDMVDGSMTVSKVRAFIEKYDIQMMCIDQFSLVDDEKHAKSPREQAINISKGLRTLQRIKKIPFLIAVQLNREESENGPSTRNIAESDRLGQDATTCLFVERKDDNVKLTVGKARSAKTGDSLLYAWNINNGILHYIPNEKDALQGEDTEHILDKYNDSDKSDSVF